MKRWRFFVQADTIAAIFIVLFWGIVLLILKNPVSLDDGLRHFAMAHAMKEGAAVWATGWSSFFYEGYLHQTIVDPWFLSNVIMIPFTYFSLATGLHLLTLASVGALIAVALLILRSFKLSAVERCFFLLRLLFGVGTFFGSFLIARPYSLVTIASLGVLYCLLQRKYVVLVPLLIVSTLLSQLFVFPFFFCACAIAIQLFTKRYAQSLRLTLYSTVALIAGLLLHPHPRSYISYLFTAFARIPFLKSIGLSREMQSGILDISMIGIAILIAVGILLVVLLREQKKLLPWKNHFTVVLLSAISSCLFVAFFFWIRAIDLLWPFLILCIASIYAIDPAVTKNFFKKWKLSKNLKTIFIAAIVVVSIGQISSMPLVFLRDDSKHSLVAYKAINDIPTGSRVLNMDWDHFSIYVALRPDLQYATGIDRSFTYLTDPSISETVFSIEESIKLGRLPQNWELSLQSILKAYPSDYIVLSHAKFGLLIDAIKQKPFTLLADDGTIAIFKQQ